MITYIQGMHCESCEDTLRSAIKEVVGVNNVCVDHTSGTAIIEGSPSKSDIFQAIKESGYEASEDFIATPNSEPTSEKDNHFTQLLPLITILIYIFLGALITNRESLDVGNFMMDFMGLFFVVFSLFKFIDYKSFPSAFSKYDPLAKSVAFYAWLYPFIEGYLALSFLLRFNIVSSIIITIVILGITSFGVLEKLVKRETVQCACIGTTLNLPLTKATIIENGIMLFMSFWMLFTVLK